MGIVEEVVPEPPGGAHLDMDAAAEALGSVISRHLDDLSALTPDDLLAQRAARFRSLGAFEER